MSDPRDVVEKHPPKPVPANSVSEQIDRHEKALLRGDLSDLSGAERKEFYKSVCDSIGLNPLTKPLEYIYLNGDLTLYANKTAAAQLRQNLSISITDLDISREEGLHVVYAYAQDETARTDVDAGIVSINGKSGEGLANARMKAITKSKRRVTLSICGLGFLDETEVDDIPDEAKKEANVRQGSGQITPRKPDRWYQQAREWMVGKVQEGAADASQFFSNADKVPSDHPLDEWPEEIAEHTISQIKQAASGVRAADDGSGNPGKARGGATSRSGSSAVSRPNGKGDPQTSSSPQTSDERRFSSHEEAIEVMCPHALEWGQREDPPPTERRISSEKESEEDTTQLGRLFRIADQNGWKDSWLDRLVKDELGFESKKHIPCGDPYNQICAALRNQEMLFWMSRDPDTPDMFEENTDEGDANHPEFEDDSDLPF